MRLLVIPGVVWQLLIMLVAAMPGVLHAQETALCGGSLAEALRGGGFNLYLRHAATEWSQTDNVRQSGDWLSCDPSRMRQLSEEGRRAARLVGEAIKSSGIPVGSVFASPYCRTVETAELMNLGPVERTLDIMNLRAAEYFGGRKAIVERARTRLAARPAPGTNAVLVAHGNLAREATQVYPGEGETLVFQPDGQGAFAFIGRLSPVQWSDLDDGCE